MTILSVRAQQCDWHFDCGFSLGAVWDLESGSQRHSGAHGDSVKKTHVVFFGKENESSLFTL